jgi:hypothetical protein
MDVDAIQQRPTDLLLVMCDGHGDTTTLFHRVAVESAGEPVRVVVATNLLHLCYIFVTPSG